MKEINEISVESTVIRVQKVLCNCCKEEISVNEYGYFDDFLSIEKRWGFGSKYDNEVHRIDICKNCYDKLLGTLEIEPEIENRQL